MTLHRRVFFAFDGSRGHHSEDNNEDNEDDDDDDNDDIDNNNDNDNDNDNDNNDDDATINCWQKFGRRI